MKIFWAIHYLILYSASLHALSARSYIILFDRVIAGMKKVSSAEPQDLQMVPLSHPVLILHHHHDHLMESLQVLGSLQRLWEGNLEPLLQII